MYNTLDEIVSKETIIKYDEIMKNHTSFKIGGKADCFAIVNTEDDLIQIIKYSKDNNIPFFIVGNGTNILASDKGIRGIVIKLGDNFKSVSFDGEYVTTGAACSINFLAQEILSQSLSGFEWAFGIPGTVGGAIFMNAGAYGGSMEDVVEETVYLDENYNLCTINKEKHEFEYRNSIFKKNIVNGVILRTKLKLTKGNKEEIWANMQKYINARIDKQPLNMPSAGSVFKRPDGYFAGKLIEDLGLKGFCIGGAQVSEKHAGFIVNKGEATANDVKKLIEHIKSKVKSEYDISLEQEIMEVGE